MKKIKKRYAQGYAAITAILLVLGSSLAVIGSLSFLTLQEVGASRAYVKSIHARYASESSIEDYLYRIMSGKQTSATDILAVGEATTTITFISPLEGQSIVRADASAGKYRSNMEARLDLPVVNSSFPFGSVIGNGGLHLSQNAMVQGSVFSNGDIIGSNGAVITGDAFAATASLIDKITVNGNAQADSIKNSTIGAYASSTILLASSTVAKDVHAGQIVNSNIGRDAYYVSIDPQSSVSGTKYPGNPAPPSLPIQPMPIPDSKITQLKTDAADLGTIASGDCSQNWSPPTNPYTVNGGVVKQNMVLGNNQVLLMKGTIWVKCNVTISNGASIKLDSSYGAYSGVLVADGWINLQNNGVFQGSGTPGSFVMLISSATGGGPNSSAINISNNTTGVIFYAQSGRIFLGNNVEATELTGKEVYLDNGATVIYNTLLADVNFSSGHYRLKYWKQVP